MKRNTSQSGASNNPAAAGERAEVLTGHVSADTECAIVGNVRANHSSSWLAVGDHVQVIAGVYKGRSGIVRSINNHWLQVDPDQAKVGGLNGAGRMVVGQSEWAKTANRGRSATPKMKTSKRNRRSRTTQERGSGLAAATLLECGHPGLPNNLKDEKCGTCQCAEEWDELAKETKDVDLKSLTLKIANCFRNGSMVYDKNGKTLMKIEEASRPHSNTPSSATVD